MRRSRSSTRSPSRRSRLATWPPSSARSRPVVGSSSSRPDGGGLRVSALTAADIILRPVISEKSIDVSTLGDRDAKAGNKYTFAVHRDANKIQIKAAIEELYAKEKVTVVSVNVLTT